MVHIVKRVVLFMLLPGGLLAGTVSLGNASIRVLGGNADSSMPPAYVTNPSAFAFLLTDGITTLDGGQRRNTDPTGGANTALEAVPTFDGRQTTISGSIAALTIADSEGAGGGHSQAFAIGLCTGGWRDQAAATYNLNLLASQPAPAKDGFSGIAFGFKNGSLYLTGYDYDSQPNQIFLDLGKAGLASGQSILAPLSFTLVYSAGSMSVSLNGKLLGTVATSHNLSSALLVAMGASVDNANGVGTMTFSNLMGSTPATTGSPALFYPISGDQQSGKTGTTLAQPLVTGVVDSFRNPLPGVLVSFAAGDATVSPVSIATDSSGHAHTNITLGSAPGPVTVLASVANLPLLAFHLTATSPASTTPPPPPSTLPVVSAIVDGASFGPKISSGGWATILGTNLSPVTDTATNTGTSMLTSLDGVSVTVHGKAAFIYYVSATQINFIVPDDPADGGVDVQVTTPLGSSVVMTADKEDFTPELFVFSSRYPAAVHADGTYLGPANLLSGVGTHPARSGEVILLFGTGFGPSTPPVPSGLLATNDALPAQLVSATVGGVPAEVQGYLIYPGLYQFNLTVPNSLPAGDAALSLSVVGSVTQSGLMLTIGQ
jgi:uncharacterized protein (TIGR03437 family)